MMSISNEDKQVYIKTSIILGTVLVIALAWLWWVKIYTDKTKVFNAMLVNNLSSFGVAKISSDEETGNSYKQISQAQFGANNLVEAKVNINQKTQAGEVNVITKTIATPKEDFMKYEVINIPEIKDQPKTNFDSVLGQWAKMPESEGGGSSFSEIVYGLIPFGNLPYRQRSELLSLIQDKKVYNTDFSKTEVIKENGRTLYKYKVSVNPKSYAVVLKKYDQMLSRNQTMQLDPEQYNGVQPIELELKVDKLSRRLVEVKYDEQRTEQYSNYGIRKTVKTPKTDLSRQELEQKLQNLLSSSNEEVL